jgi:hypothetical protein
LLILRDAPQPGADVPRDVYSDDPSVNESFDEEFDYTEPVETVQ